MSLNLKSLNLRQLFLKYREIILYVFFGGCTTLLDFLVYWCCTDLLNLPAQLSNVISWICAVLFAFVTNKRLVFGSESKEPAVLLKELVGFFGGRLLTLGLSAAMLWLGADILHINDLIVKLAANVFVIIANYFISKLVVFRRRK